MNPPGSAPPPERVPTLTEVVEVDRWTVSGAGDAASPLPMDEQLVRRIMAELQRQIDVMLEYRVREVLGPVLARAADAVVRDARTELASTLRDVVARAVENELSRQQWR